MSEPLQVHLTSKVKIPAVPESEQVVDGKPVKTPAVPEKVVQICGMSNRVVRYRVLEPDEIGEVYEDAAKAVGESGTQRRFMVLAQLYLCQAMIVSYSEPTDNPLDPNLKWTKADTVAFINHASPEYWSKVFTAKDTAFLQKQYSKWHELPPAELELLSGKETLVVEP